MNKEIKSQLEKDGWNVDGIYAWKIINNEWKVEVNTETEKVKIYKLNK